MEVGMRNLYILTLQDVSLYTQTAPDSLSLSTSVKYLLHE